ncbi:uncharacterized protein LOC130804316 [Amaranthus tricolor]|uniref:uncharacterized protein LOC130804316 n=1 Tax=Amaranthus tricolor TaxID=29722 RepID=UPI002583D355|nr:uncharacterized protein LOC130804316 [Amaranthus tricolor]XP_057524692.1 uncharacterized protein LOC130804316 [Amaranthus tricolor]
MGAGRKTENVVMQNKPPPQPTSNAAPRTARNLRKNDLGAVIFGCKHSTFNECNSKLLFGLPSFHIKYVQNVSVGMPLFLFNYSDRKLHGIYEATSHGQMYLDEFAWSLDGEEVTMFPAQVQVKVRMQCRPLAEEQFKPIIAKNYNSHEPNHFWFELDHTQTNRLITLFSASAFSQGTSVPRTTEKWGYLIRQPVTPVAPQENSWISGNTKQKVVVQDFAKKEYGVSERKTWSSLFKHLASTSNDEDEDSNSEGASNISEDKDPVMYEDEAPPVCDAEAHPTCEDEARPICEDEACLTYEAPPIYEDEAPSICEDEAFISAEKICGIVEVSVEEMNSDHHAIVNRLMQAIGEMNALHVDQAQKVLSLEQELVEARKRIEELESCNPSHGSGEIEPPYLNGHVEELQVNNFLDSGHSMLLLGGFNGSSWLQDLDLYIPSEDVIQALEPMKSIRTHTSALKFKDSLYVLGGGYSTSWYDTVESYDLRKQQWLSCPPLNRKKGNLAGVSLDDTIYAIGGGDAGDCFSDVEMLKLGSGKWLLTSSMQQKRFSSTAAQINGVLYVVGGYDGGDYLSSIERYDPRENSWTMLKSMSTRRGCHSMTVLNEKLYVIGGYDGVQMVPTAEVFEPRVGSWMMLEPMKYARGYMGCVTLGNFFCVISGMQENDQILDSVECYSEGKGWELTDLKAIGKRCFLSAVAL